MSSGSFRRPGQGSRPATVPEGHDDVTEVSAPTQDARTVTWPDEPTPRGPVARVFPGTHIQTDTMIMIGIVVVSLVMRLIGLGDRPLHHDESLHATYSWYLMGRTNPQYYYDPMMHGPLQFHMIAFFYSIFGSSPFTARLWSVTAGTALVVVPWLLRKQLGRWPTFALMALLSLSPTTLYFSRFAREDMQFALFTLLMVVTLLRYIADRADGNRYHYRWLYLLGVATTMAYAAKEGIYLNVVMFGAFLAVALGIELLRGNWIAAPVPGVLLGAYGFVAGGKIPSVRLYIPGFIPGPTIGGVSVSMPGILIEKLGWSVVGALIVLGVMCYAVATSPGTGPVSQALRDTPRRAWLLTAALIVTLFVLLYWPIGAPWQWAFVPGSHMEATTLDIPGQAAQPYSYSTDGLTGGFLYWQAQQPVARGGQPWYYYLFIIPLYEWVATLFGIIGAVYVLLKRRTLVTLLVLWWTLASFAIYGWTSEKMPWNALHLVVPLSVLAAIGLVASVTAARKWVRYVAIVAAIFTGVITLHNSLTLSYVNGANPTEYLMYVQTTPDVPKVYSEMQLIQSHINGPMHLQVDSEDTWPWAFYLRDSSKWWVDAYPTKPTDYGAPTQPVLIVGTGADDPSNNYAAMENNLAGRYVAFRESLRWWNPEEYKTYAQRTDSNGQLLSRVQRAKYFLEDLVSPTTWWNIWQWETARRPFTPGAWNCDANDSCGNQVVFWFLVQKQYVQYLSPDYQALAKTQMAKAVAHNPFLNAIKPVQPVHTFTAAQTSVTSVGPVATAADGNALVADETGHRIVELSPSGGLVRSWGSAGFGNGQFNGQQQPSIGGIAVAPNGNVYATDTWNGRVQEFSPTGAFIRAWGQQNLGQSNLKPDDFYGPRGIAVGPDGDVYVADTGHKRVQVFTGTGGFVRSIGQAGTQPGQFNEPSSVAVDRLGRVYVADFWNGRVQVFTASGKYQSAFMVAAWQNGGYDEPQIAVDGLSRVFVPDSVSGNVLVYSASGKPLYEWGNAATASQFTKPLFISASSAGAVLVGDSGSNTISLFQAP